MGYYVNLIGAEFVIPENAEVLQALKDLNHKPGVEKHGGSYAGGQQTRSWFSWMPENYDETVTSAQEVFELLGFECTPREDAFELMGYDSKIGQEHLFIQEVAPYVAEGSYLEWLGEDGARWKYVVEGGIALVYEPSNSWQLSRS